MSVSQRAHRSGAEYVIGTDNRSIQQRGSDATGDVCKWIQCGKEKSAGDKVDQGEEGMWETESNRRVIFSQCHKYCCVGFVGPTYSEADTGHNRSQQWLTGYWLAPENSPDLHSGDTPLHRHIPLPLRQPLLTCHLRFCRSGCRNLWRLIKAPIMLVVFSFSVLDRLSRM